MTLNKRINAYRPDLAADFLRGTVAAEKFVPGQAMRVTQGHAALHRAPRADAARDSELLFGEIFTVYENKDGWCWGQAASDGYVGYVRSDALDAPLKTDHRVTALMTPLLPSPEVKSFAIDMLPLNARVLIDGQEGNYAHLASGGFVYALALAEKSIDWVAMAERFAGVPYLWGGKTFAGTDCSGLIQTAMQAAGLTCPRDTDMQENHFITAVEASDARRGDLIFWKGHVGVMLDETRLLHANAHHMAVAVEPLADAITRTQKTTGPITSVKRPR